jgi:hypothetical protein
VSDATLKYPLWQNHYLQAMAETRPDLLKSKFSAAEQVVSLRLSQPATTKDDYREQIALAAALQSVKVLKERQSDPANHSLSRCAITALRVQGRSEDPSERRRRKTCAF